MSKKKIAFFNTNGSDEASNTFSVISELAKNQKLVAKLVVSKVKKTKRKLERK